MVDGDGRAREQKPPDACGVRSAPSLWDLGVCLGMSWSLGDADSTTEVVSVPEGSLLWHLLEPCMSEWSGAGEWSAFKIYEGDSETV